MKYLLSTVKTNFASSWEDLFYHNSGGGHGIGRESGMGFGGGYGWDIGNGTGYTSSSYDCEIILIQYWV